MWLSLRLITQGDDDPQQKWDTTWKSTRRIKVSFCMYIVRKKANTKLDLMLHLCKSLEDGPKCPKPDAIVFISTIATQQ
jgi:hypothetical protein